MLLLLSFQLILRQLLIRFFFQPSFFVINFLS